MPHPFSCCGLMIALTALGCAAPQQEPSNRRESDVKLTSRERWPAGAPMRVRLDYKGPLMLHDQLNVVATPRFADATTIKEWIPPTSWMVQYSPEYMFSDKNAGNWRSAGNREACAIPGQSEKGKRAPVRHDLVG